ncbi:hypothetical protein LILPAPAWES_59 [Morganella phage vB_MmoP_Lilpapawes]|uniref:Uncharacterized protein n=1 Tax=Morganella phage vB_MmoP_Lilpapawes TaxID=2894803 RepID=A0AAE8YSH6_9CAUD|nr:hypothetical protein LILPAPAWES_59 [Morganella phage vB_MmoP_Lilpapawes]
MNIHLRPPPPLITTLRLLLRVALEIVVIILILPLYLKENIETSQGGTACYRE